MSCFAHRRNHSEGFVAFVYELFSLRSQRLRAAATNHTFNYSAFLRCIQIFSPLSANKNSRALTGTTAAPFTIRAWTAAGPPPPPGSSREGEPAGGPGGSEVTTCARPRVFEGKDEPVAAEDGGSPAGLWISCLMEIWRSTEEDILIILILVVYQQNLLEPWFHQDRPPPPEH